MYSSAKASLLFAVFLFSFAVKDRLIASYVYTAQNEPADPTATATINPIKVNTYDFNNNEVWDKTDAGATGGQPHSSILATGWVSLLHIANPTTFNGTTGDYMISKAPSVPGEIRAWKFESGSYTQISINTKHSISVGSDPIYFYIEGLANTYTNTAVSVSVFWDQEITVDGRSKLKTASSTARTGVYEVDADVDSDNNGTIGGAGAVDAAEDQIEFADEAQQLGKIVIKNPGFAGGMIQGGAVSDVCIVSTMGKRKFRFTTTWTIRFPFSPICMASGCVAMKRWDTRSGKMTCERLFLTDYQHENLSQNCISSLYPTGRF